MFPRKRADSASRLPWIQTVNMSSSLGLQAHGLPRRFWTCPSHNHVSQFFKINQSLSLRMCVCVCVCVQKNIALAKKFVRVFPLHLTEKPKRNLWPTNFVAYIYTHTHTHTHTHIYVYIPDWYNSTLNSAFLSQIHKIIEWMWKVPMPS